MAKKTAEVDVPVRKKRIRYYAKFNSYGFDVVAVSEDGTPKIKRNNQGQPLYDNDGNEIPIHKHYRFLNLVNRMNKGYLSYFDFDPNDTSAQNVKLGERLAQLHTDRHLPGVMNEDAYDAETNSAMFYEKKRAEALEDEVVRLRAENERLQSPEELQKRLDELTKA